MSQSLPEKTDEKQFTIKCPICSSPFESLKNNEIRFQCGAIIQLSYQISIDCRNVEFATFEEWEAEMDRLDAKLKAYPPSKRTAKALICNNGHLYYLGNNLTWEEWEEMKDADQKAIWEKLKEAVAAGCPCGERTIFKIPYEEDINQYCFSAEQIAQGLGLRQIDTHVISGQELPVYNIQEAVVQEPCILYYRKKKSDPDENRKTETPKASEK